MTSALEGGEWSAARPAALYRRGRSRTHTLTSRHSVGLLCTSDQPVAEVATYTKSTRYERPYAQRDSNSRSRTIKWLHTHASDLTTITLILHTHPSLSTSTLILYTQPPHSTSTLILHTQPPHSSSTLNVHTQPPHSTSTLNLLTRPLHSTSTLILHTHTTFVK